MEEQEIDLNAARGEARFFFRLMQARQETLEGSLRIIGMTRKTQGLLEEWLREMPADCREPLQDGESGEIAQPFRIEDLRFREAVLRFFTTMVQSCKR